MIRLLLSVLLLLLLSGCYGMKDMDKRFFVVGIGVDQSGDEEQPYLVTFKLAIPSPRIEPGVTDQFQILSQKGATISEAIQRLQAKADKEFDYGHMKVVVIGKTLAAEDISRAMDWFYRRRDIQLICYVSVGDPSAKDVLEVRPKSERLPMNALILSFSHEGTESALVVKEYLYDFFRRVTERGDDPFAPVIRAMDETYSIDRVAVFDHQKMKDVMDPDDTRIIQEMVRSSRKFEIVTDMGSYKFSTIINHYDRSYRIINPASPQPTIKINVNLDGFVQESFEPVFLKQWSELTKPAENQEKERILKTLTKLRDNGVDPVGFGLRYRAMGYTSDEEWSSWLERYPNLQFDVSVKLKLRGSGVIK